MNAVEVHLESLTRHIDYVRQGCFRLGKTFISNGEEELGRDLIARGMIHDASKFTGIEWDYLHQGDDIPQECILAAIHRHHSVNDHHPEYWDDISEMSRVAVAEMVCDWLARSQEYATDLKKWIKEVAVKKYGIDLASEIWYWIEEFVGILLEPQMKRSWKMAMVS